MSPQKFVILLRTCLIWVVSNKNEWDQNISDRGRASPRFRARRWIRQVRLCLLSWKRNSRLGSSERSTAMERSKCPCGNRWCASSCDCAEGRADALASAAAVGRLSQAKQRPSWTWASVGPRTLDGLHVARRGRTLLCRRVRSSHIVMLNTLFWMYRDWTATCRPRTVNDRVTRVVIADMELNKQRRTGQWTLDVY